MIYESYFDRLHANGTIEHSHRTVVDNNNDNNDTVTAAAMMDKMLIDTHTDTRIKFIPEQLSTRYSFRAVYVRGLFLK